MNSRRRVNSDVGPLNMDVDSQIERIRSKLSIVRPRKWWRGPHLRAASLEEVVAWERQHQVTIPDAYRTFLTQIANGVGWACELVRLDQWWHHLVPGDDLEARRLWPSQPCVLRAGLKEDDNWLERIAEDKSREGPDLATWSPWAGTIGLSDEGCGSLAVLIMTGALRGRICHLDFLNAPVFSPQLNFLDWYEARLDGAPW
jgi:hypothetical protein